MRKKTYIYGEFFANKIFLTLDSGHCYLKGGGRVGIFIFMYVIQHCFICRSSDATVSEDAGIEPGAVAT